MSEKCWRWGVVRDVVAGYGLYTGGIVVRFPIGTRYFSSSPGCQDTVMSIQPAVKYVEVPWAFHMG